jgi:hydrogenase expression/formation protein HypE
MSHITLAHGNGGRFMRELIEQVFARHLKNPILNIEADATTLPADSLNGDLMITTDGFTVKPLEFPGGDIGSLAVHGTVNDLAVAGATAKYLSLNVIIEEGLEIEVLERIVVSLGKAAKEAGVQIVAGDTKVVPRGEGSGLYLATTGIGIKHPALDLGMHRIQAGDAILVSGPVGDHGIAVMLAREQFGLKGDIQSDNANVYPLTNALLELAGLRFMRDPTRGGLATVLHEIHTSTGFGIRAHEPCIPIRDTVQSVCEILGYNPMYLACEGRVVAVIDNKDAEQALTLWHSLQQGKDAAIIGHVSSTDTRVVIETELGGERYLEELEDDPLPRIC